MKRCVASLTPMVVLACVSAAQASGPDLIVGFIEGGNEHAVLPTGELALSVGTNSCNAGDENLDWMKIPDNRHPVISLNVYQVQDDQIRQLAGSWVKHGFFATNQDACRDIKGVPACVPAASNQLGPGCSDPYGEGLNANPNWLGPRSRINPTTGSFDGATAQTPDENAEPIANAAKTLVVPPDLLSISKARYFVEAHYITSDDAASGNYRNNVTHKEFAPREGSDSFVFRYIGPEARGEPAIMSWPGAKFSEVHSTENGMETAVIVASKATKTGGGDFRYDYAVYNMNSDRAVGAFEVAGQIDARDLSFYAPKIYGEPWDQASWNAAVGPGLVSWAGPKFEENPRGNAIRWGTTYSFSFVADGPPLNGSAKVLKFKPGQSGDVDELSFDVVVPSD